MVHYMAQHQAAASQPASSPDDLTAEIAAMQKIGTALAGLNDEVRLRVLRWAAERFSPLAPVQVAATQPNGQDTTLAVDSLEDFFDTRSPGSQVEQAPCTSGAEPVESMVKGFVDDFQRIAREWQGA